MRLLPSFIRLTSGTDSAHTTETGATGTLTARGTQAVGFGAGILLQEDYNPDLRGTALYDEYDKMRLSDSVVKGVMRAVKLPLLSADWKFEPGEESEQQEQIADWLTSSINQMNWDWSTVLRHILLYLDYGNMPFEVVFEVRDDTTFRRPMACLRKLAPRMPRTIIEWVLDESGGLAGIVQQVTTLDDKAYQNISIPIENLLVFINELEGSNYKGISLLRAARKDWFYKDRFQRLGGIIMEKRGVGVDVGKLTNGNEDKKNAAEKVLQDIRSHERSYLLETEDFEYRIEGAGAGRVLDPLPWVNYYDLTMLRGLLAEFLAMGDGSGGSFAMHADKTSFFLMNLTAIGQDVTGIINRHLVPRWCDMNWPGLKVYPKLTHSRLDRRDVQTVVSALQALIPANVIHIDPHLEEEVRELLELPPVQDTSPATPAPLPEDDEKTKLKYKHKRSKLTDRVNWVALASGMDGSIETIVSAVADWQKKQIEILVREIAKRVEESELDFSEIVVPYKSQEADSIQDALMSLYKTGQSEAKKELQASSSTIRMAETGTPSDDASFLRARSKSMSSVLSSRLLVSAQHQALDMVRSDDFNAAQLIMNLKGLSDRTVRSEAGAAVSEAMNLGRQSVAEQNKDNVKRVEFSAILDQETCDQCREEDGKTWSSVKAAQDARPPYKKCLGRNRCRCVLVYTFEDEVD